MNEVTPVYRTPAEQTHSSTLFILSNFILNDIFFIDNQTPANLTEASKYTSSSEQWNTLMVGILKCSDFEWNAALVAVGRTANTALHLNTQVNIKLKGTA